MIKKGHGSVKIGIPNTDQVISISRSALIEHDGEYFVYVSEEETVGAKQVTADREDLIEMEHKGKLVLYNEDGTEKTLMEADIINFNEKESENTEFIGLDYLQNNTIIVSPTISEETEDGPDIL